VIDNINGLNYLLGVSGKVTIEIFDENEKVESVFKYDNTISDKTFRDVNYMIRNYFNNDCPNISDFYPWSGKPFSTIVLLSDFFSFQKPETSFECIAFKTIKDCYKGTNLNTQRARRVFIFNKNEANGTIKSIVIGSLTPEILSYESSYYEYVDSYVNSIKPIKKTNKKIMRITYDYIFKS